ncbi:hypothetical protein Pst134EA_020903 [Puccinia striiformis f. sp. tritici]|uniref:hypothetical protein n=1 Tax=Puccinia striiformis f. sp. tritici TaxID=168172 RepID=UPI0020073D54|nr:hypothetical protein Pst134EA_020903 [Puccinia striiformis f. sp. tritici]KAH9456999.1 hypothetical protein Pst134EA_020903 [Puccinia striiformis f. sp. tritici]
MILNDLFIMILAINLFSIIITSTSAAVALPKTSPRGCKIRVATASVVGPGIEGTFHFRRMSNEKGKTTLVNIKVTGLKAGDKYHYHIHNDPIDKSGNCDSAHGHFNPTNSAVSKCPTTHRGQCETGDLSGKYGQLVGNASDPEVSTRYIDSALKLTSSKRGILQKSIVIHNSEMKRIACGTILPDKC